MAEYRISERARQRLIEIYAYTVSNYGPLQADAYHAGFEKTFELIANYPGTGRSADELRHGYRRYRYQSRYIFCTLEADYVVIRTVLHTAQDLRPDLFD